MKVTVKAPSRGLVTRVPSELADVMDEKDAKRPFVEAQNVRFEDGVVAAAPGYESVTVSGGTLSDLDVGLVAHWKFDEVAAPFLDKVGEVTFGDTGGLFEVDGVTAVTSGKFSGAINFNGVSTDLTGLVLDDSVAPLFNFAGSFTIAGWIRLNVAGDVIRIVGRGGSGNNPQLYDGGALFGSYTTPFNYEVTAGSNFVSFAVQDNTSTVSTVTIAGALSIGDWYFFAAVHTQGVGIKLRVNAVTSSTTAHTTGVECPAVDYMTIGMFTTDIQPTFSLDSLSFWGVALSSTQLNTLYNTHAGQNYPFLGGPVRFAWQANYLQADPYPLLIGTDTQMYSGTKDFTASPRGYSLALTSLYTHPSSASEGENWSAVDFYNKVVFTQALIPPQYWTTGTTTAVVPGLPTGDTYDGVTAFQNHLLLWKDLSLYWSDLNDFSVWVPVANTIASYSFTTEASFSQPAAAASTPVPPLTGSVYVTPYPDGLTVGQYLKIDESATTSPAYYNFYELAAVTPGAELSAVSVATSQTVAISATAGRIFITAHKGWEAGQILKLGASSNYVKVAACSNSTTETYVTKTVAELVDAGANDTITNLPLVVSTNLLRVGDYVSIGANSAASIDIYLITAVSTNTSDNTTQISLTQQNYGSGQRVPSPTAVSAGSVVTPQPWITVAEVNAAAVTVPSSSDIIEKYGVQLTTLNFTGRRTAAATIAISTLQTLDANEAGSAQIVGADDNGAIWAVVPMGDYAIILKNRAVQVLQYVGRISGTFFVRTEVRNEGLIARNAYARLNSDRLVFLGNRDLYLYRGGQTPVPICQQYVRQLYAELDRGQLDKIHFLHREARNEVWIVYPISGGQKVLIWNHVENSVTIDVYPDELLELTSIANCRWETDPAWNDFSDQQTWDYLLSSIAWDDLAGTGSEEVGLLATGDGSLLVHGRLYSQGGEAYTALAETMDYDFGDASRVKHVEGVQLSLQVKEPTDQVQTLYVQVGTKMNADAPVTWSAARSIDARGGYQNPTRVPFSASGRFVRVRFYSSAADVRWRIGGFTIFARGGGTY